MTVPSTPRLDRLRRHQAWLRWRYYLLTALLMAVVVGGPYLIISTFGWRIWSVALSIIAIAATYPFMKRMPEWTAAAREARREWLSERAQTEDRPPVLMLRSFRSTITVAPEPTLKLFGPERPINEPTSPAAAQSHVLDIAKHVRALGPVVAIGEARRGIAMAARIDALMLETSDDDWFQVFEVLSEAARAVVVLPGETASLGEELRSLRARGLIAKVVFVMPAHWRRTFGSWRIGALAYNDKADVLKDGWLQAQVEFERLGIYLPAYDEDGLAFTIDANGRVKQSVSLDRSFVPLERAINELVPLEAINPQSLGEAMKCLRHMGLGVTA